MIKYIKMIHERQRTWDEASAITPKMSLMQMYRGTKLTEYKMNNVPVSVLVEMIAYLEKFEGTFDFCFDHFKSEKIGKDEEFCLINQCSIFILEEHVAHLFKLQYGTKR